VYRAADGLHMQDIESGVYHSLWSEIPSRETFDHQALSALEAYIGVLYKVLYDCMMYHTRICSKVNTYVYSVFSLRVTGSLCTWSGNKIPLG